MTPPASFTPAERLTSLKGAGLGSGVAGLVEGIWQLGRRLIGLAAPLDLAHLFAAETAMVLLRTVVIAGLSGALFTLTYRYAVRQDDNPH